EALRAERQLEGAGDSGHVDRVLGDPVTRERVERAREEAVGHPLIEARHRDADAESLARRGGLCVPWHRGGAQDPCGKPVRRWPSFVRLVRRYSSVPACAGISSGTCATTTP